MTAESPWKPCDLRGEFPFAITEDLFRRVGAAAGSRMRAGDRAIVAGDFRLSTPVLKTALIEGLISVGIHVLDAGQIPTPVAYFAKREAGAEALFVVTASHNPACDNGLKMMIGEKPPTEIEINGIRSAAERCDFRRQAATTKRYDPVPSYRQWMLSRWQALNSTPFGKVILDPGHGAWSILAPSLFRQLGFDIECIFCEPDGNFPGRASDCNRTANLTPLRAAVRERHAALGIAWDGDGDRVAFVDSNGRHASTDEVSILFLRRALADAAKPVNVVCDIKLSDAVRRSAVALGGTPSLEKSGHAFMRSRVIEEQALLGLDACGHYFFQELGFGDDGLFAALYMIDLLHRSAPLATLIGTLDPIYSTPELRLPESLMNFAQVSERLRDEFPNAPENHIDGMRIELCDGIVLARKSSTEPVVSLRIEGSGQASYEELLARCLSALPPAAALIRSQVDC